MSRKIKLKVNGQVHRVSADPDTPLIYVLRNDLGLKGTQFGCGLGQCGACTVLINGKAAPSCRMPVSSLEGREVTTIEGLGTADRLHPLQEAFMTEQAVQCGFCTSGMMVAAKALLERHPQPSDADIRAGMSGNLCRCGVYARVQRAIKRAAGQPVGTPPWEEVIEERGASAPEEDCSSGPSGAVLKTLSKTPELDSWTRVNTDGTITLFTGKIEMGQDLRTSIAMIGADELDVPLDRIRVIMADTAQSPDEGFTASSLSLETSGNALRYAAAEVRRLALSAAHEAWGVPMERLIVEEGAITDPMTGQRVTYWDLFAGKPFGGPVLGGGRPKGPEAYRIVGRPLDRLDLRAKVTGGGCFVQDMDLPGMVHGRVVRSSNPRAGLVSVDEGCVSGLQGVMKVVRDGSFLAAIAEREEQAVRAAEALQKTSVWEIVEDFPPQETLFEDMLRQKDQASLVADGKPLADSIPPIKTPPDAAQTLSAAFYRPFHMHAALGPSAAVAQIIDGRLTVWTHSQGVYPLREAMAEVLGMKEDDIRVIHRDGPGCFGHNGADDAALDAALLARALPERPVSLKWMRADENAWEPYGPATVVKMEASLNREGDVIDWNHDVWGYAHSSRPHAAGNWSSLAAAWHLSKPLEYLRPGLAPGPYGCLQRNADPLYTFPNRRIVMHYLRDSPLRVSAMRGLGSYANVFALESFMDEMAHAAGADPLEFRLRYLGDERARAVLQAAVKKAGRRPEGQGRGIAFARYKNHQCYVAVVVDLSVHRESGRIHLEHAVVAVDVGQIVNPDGLSNQLEGIMTQSASWTLNEQVTFDRKGITSLDWKTYPILKFRDVPKIDTVLLNRPGRPYLGLGEGAQGPIPAAIANGVFDAVGVRLRKIPFTPERVKEALG